MKNDETIQSMFAWMSSDELSDLRKDVELGKATIPICKEVDSDNIDDERTV